MQALQLKPGRSKSLICEFVASSTQYPLGKLKSYGVMQSAPSEWAKSSQLKVQYHSDSVPTCTKWVHVVRN